MSDKCPVSTTVQVFERVVSMYMSRIGIRQGR